MNSESDAKRSEAPTHSASLVRSPSVVVMVFAGAITAVLALFAVQQSFAAATVRATHRRVLAEIAEMRLTADRLSAKAESLRKESERFDADIRAAEADRKRDQAAAGRQARQHAERTMSGALGRQRRDNIEQIVRTIVTESGNAKYDRIGRDVLTFASNACVELFPNDPIASLESVFAGEMSSMGLSDRALVHVTRERNANAASPAPDSASESAPVASSSSTASLPSGQPQSGGDSSSADSGSKAAAQEFQSLRKLAVAQHRDGKVKEAFDTCKAAQALLPKLSETSRPKTESDLLTLMARWHDEAGEKREALTLAMSAYSIMRAVTTKVDAYAEKGNAAARMHLRLAEPAEAATLLDTLIAELKADGKPDDGGQMLTALILRSHAARLLGKTDEENATYERVLGAYWHQTQRYGNFDDPDWVEYLIARGELERAETTLWLGLRRQFQMGNKVDALAIIERLAKLMQEKGDSKRAEMYRRSADRLRSRAASGTSQPEDAADG
jgi:tetratricopeptide (TPR) repeat protein